MPPTPDFLRRRNALWQALRTLSAQGDRGPEFEARLAELGALTGWDRARLLAGLGEPADPTPPESLTPPEKEAP